MVKNLSQVSKLSKKDGSTLLRKRIVYLQYKSPSQTNYCILSNSKSSVKFRINKCAMAACRQARPKDVLQCTIDYSKDTPVLLKCTPYYKDVPHMIGDPCEILQSPSDHLTRKGAKVSSDLLAGVWQGLSSFQVKSVHNFSSQSPSYMPNNRITMISKLTPANRNWEINARVVFKSNVIEYATGKLFKAILIDSSGVIELVFYKEECTQKFDKVKEGEIITVTNGRVRSASKYNNTENPVEIIFYSRSTLIVTTDKENNVPFQPLCLPDLSSLQSTETKIPDSCSVVGIVVSVELRIIDTEKGPKKLTRVSLTDENGHRADICLWGEGNDRTMFTPNTIVYCGLIKKSYFFKNNRLITDFTAYYMTKVDLQALPLNA